MSATGGLNLDAATIPELQQALAAGELTAVALTQAYLDRIAAFDPRIGAVIATHPSALSDAAASDARSQVGAPRRPLEGIPVLVKDNIAVGGLPTTAGSRAMRESAPPDAPLVTRLREAGAIIIGKANLSEWANFRDEHSTSGWSAVGGQTRNPYSPDRSTSGSSSGSAAAVAAALSQVSIGSETDGSIISPAGVCGIVGSKPTFGLVPGSGIVPISSHQDTAGPMARNVIDAAIAHAVLCGTSPPDVSRGTLRGTRLAVWRPAGLDEASAAVFDAAVAAVVAVGVVTTEVDIDASPIHTPEWPALFSEFRQEIDGYLAAAPGAGVRSLAELIAFNKADPDELTHFGQSLLEQALEAPGIDDATYLAHRTAATREARRILDEALDGVDAVLTLTNDPAWPIDYATGDTDHVATTSPAAVSGYPSITVPAGFAGDLPIGASLIGRPRADEQLWQLAYALEQTLAARRAPDYLALSG